MAEAIRLPLWKAALLGLVQGLTEFLPVSSSGHLVIAENLLGLRLPGLSFEVWLHFGTLVAALLYFRDIWVQLVRAAFSLLRPPAQRSDEERQGLVLIGRLIVATAATGLVGLLLLDRAESLFKEQQAVGWALLATAAILWLSGRARPARVTAPRATGLAEPPGVVGSVLIGLAQGAALIPGVSRSGSTIAAGLGLGLRPEAAARFWFLLAVPGIVGISLLDLLRGGPIGQATGVGWPAIAVGASVAAISGLVGIGWLLRSLVRRGLRPFVPYLLLVGALAILTA